MRSNIYLALCETEPPIVREGKAKAQESPPRRVREEAVVSIWMEQPWAPHPVRDVKGKMVEIISPGWLKGGAGPDFCDALFRYNNGAIEKGDVEIHVRSSDWLRHKHFRDPAYNDTRLHVVLYCDSKNDPRTVNSGEALIEIELANVCAGVIDRIRSRSPVKQSIANLALITGKCSEALANLGASNAFQIIEAAGEARMEFKSKRYLAAIKKGVGEEELYQGILEALGYQAFKIQFGRVAREATLKKLRGSMEDIRRTTRSAVLQGILFGVAGLLPRHVTKDDFDEETSAYIGGSLEAWERIAEKCGFEQTIGSDEWKLAGSRPANFPAGRLAGLSYFLSTYLESDLERVFPRILEECPVDGKVREIRKWINAVSNLFSSPADDYWAWRYALGGKKLAKPRKLIGKERVELILVNIILPFALARAQSRKNKREEEIARRIFRVMPSTAQNSVVRLMAQRMCGGIAANELARGSIRRQGLTQVYTDFCTVNEQRCEACGFATYLENLFSQGVILSG